MCDVRFTFVPVLLPGILYQFPTLQSVITNKYRICYYRYIVLIFVYLYYSSFCIYLKLFTQHAKKPSFTSLYPPKPSLLTQAFLSWSPTHTWSPLCWVSTCCMGAVTWVSRPHAFSTIHFLAQSYSLRKINHLSI